MAQSFKTISRRPGIENVLKRDSSSKQEIKLLQEALFELGYGRELQWHQFGADGDFGNATTAALTAFNQKSGLDTENEAVSAKVAEKIAECHEVLPDLRLLNAVRRAEAAESLLAFRAPHKDLIIALQRMLNAVGSGKIDGFKTLMVDGDYGNGTTGAVKLFATQEGVETDGKQMDADLVDRIIAKYEPFLGTDWESARDRPIRNRSRTSQFDLLFPKSGRDVDRIKSLLAAEYRFQDKFHEIPGESFNLDFVSVTRKDGDASFFYHREEEKKRIVLHFTAGQVVGDIRTLSTKNNKVSTQYILDRDGTVYEMFPNPKFWSYHLGPDAIGGNKTLSKSSVGIEISSWGPLREDGKGGLVTWEGGHWYCDLEEEDAYIKLEQPYREAKYMAALTPQQYDSLIVVLRHLTKTLDIPVIFLPPGKRDKLFSSPAAARNFAGIACHTNFRLFGKWDFCEEGFDWERVIRDISADDFLPESARTRSRSLFDGPRKQNMERALEELRQMDAGDQDPDAYGEEGLEVDI